MSKIRAFSLAGKLFTLLLLTAGLAGCSLGDDLPVCDLATIIVGSNYPNYRNTPADLAPPSFSWSFFLEEGGEAECHPAFQHIRFGLRSFDETGIEILTELEGSDLLGFSREWTATTALTAGTAYFWELTWYGEGGADPHSQRWGFNSGPTCERTELLPPVILSLPDGTVVEAPAQLSWYYQGGCTPDGIEFRYSNTPETDPTRMEALYYDRAYHGLVGFEACQEYYWAVASTLIVPPTEILFMPPDPPGLPWAEPLEYEYTGYLRSEYTAIRRFYVIGDACPVAPEGFGPLLTAEPSLLPRVRTLVEANCRSGTSLGYPILSILPAGQQYDIEARNTAGDYWRIFDPAIDSSCWVFGDLVEVSGDTSLVMIIDPEPPGLTRPSDTPAQAGVDCSQYNTDPVACNNNQACWWDSSVPPNGECKNK